MSLGAACREAQGQQRGKDRVLARFWRLAAPSREHTALPTFFELPGLLLPPPEGLPLPPEPAPPFLGLRGILADIHRLPEVPSLSRGR